ncbi:MAG: hypothetical protein AAF399_14715 [Bacteroidota bacterium]
MNQPTQPFTPPPYARAILSLAALLLILLGGLTWHLSMPPSAEEQSSVLKKLQSVEVLPADSGFLNAQLKGSSLEVTFAGNADHRPVVMRLYDRSGQLIYTEKNPQLGLGKGWKADMSRFVQTDSESYQLKLELDNGAELLTWVNQ